MSISVGASDRHASDRFDLKKSEDSQHAGNSLENTNFVCVRTHANDFSSGARSAVFAEISGCLRGAFSPLSSAKTYHMSVSRARANRTLFAFFSESGMIKIS
jgi:hypothetical protein